MRIHLRRRLLACCFLAPAVVVACIVSSTNRGESLTTAGAPRWVRSPIKAHLADGSTALFRAGANVGANGIVGKGKRFSPTLDSSAVDSIPLSDIVGVETFDREVNTGRTLVYSTISGAVTAVAAAALAIVIFGSCPTIYADSAGTQTLQAESFSYSIAPLLEKRDVDLLSVQPDANGVIRLDVRNEALETHYIDQLQLLEARHRTDEVVMPVAKGRLAALRNVFTPTTMRDSHGHDVLFELSRADGVLFNSTGAVRAARDTSVGTQDYIDITLPRAQRRRGRDSVAVVLNMRSSLLSTTIFYDHMLARHGARSLDWVGHDLTRITTVADVAKWYADHFGLRVSVRDGDEWKPVVRLMDFGPAAWRTVAAMVPDVGDDSLRIRLAFVADEFRIDRVAVSRDIRAVEPRMVDVARIINSAGQRRDDVRDFLRRADERRLSTSPGDRLLAEFDAGKPRPNEARTYLLAATGYYVEWVRPNWIASATDTLPFSSRTTTREVLHSWIESRDSLESHFFVDRAPVR